MDKAIQAVYEIFYLVLFSAIAVVIVGMMLALMVVTIKAL